jgi:L-lysine 6-transaminase
VAGGGLAVENMMKAAFDWKAQKNRARGIEGGADKILHFRDAFHGRTGYTLSVTNTDPTKTDDLPQFDWPRISSPYIDFPLDEAAIVAKEDAACAEIESAFDRDPDGIAAILIEPIQAEGGDHHFRPEFFAKLRDYADRFEALLIFDEVQTSLGSTGTMWAFEQSGVVPDLIAFGKKTQVCGMMSTRRIDEIESNVFHVSSRINSTWGGNLTDMVRCVRYLQIIHEDGLVENAARVGAVVKDGLEGLAKEFESVTNVRGKGLLVAFDVPDGDVRASVVQEFWDRGLAVLSCGPRSVRLRPPLVFSASQVTQVLATLREVFDDLL